MLLLPLQLDVCPLRWWWTLRDAAVVIFEVGCKALGGVVELCIVLGGSCPVVRGVVSEAETGNAPMSDGDRELLNLARVRGPPEVDGGHVLYCKSLRGLKFKLLARTFLVDELSGCKNLYWWSIERTSWRDPLVDDTFYSSPILRLCISERPPAGLMMLVDCS